MVTEKENYYLTVQSFMNAPVYKAEKRKAELISLGCIGSGAALPLALGFLTALPDIGKEYFRISFLSNSIVSLIFCLPVSIGLIWAALPLYRYMMDKLFIRHGFVRA